MKLSSVSFDKLFIFSGIILPILFQYTTPIEGFTFGDALLVISIVCYVGVHFRKLHFNSSIIILAVYIFVITIFITSGGFDLPVFLTTLRYIVYLIYLMIMRIGSKCVDFALLFYKRVCMVAVLLLYIQYIMLHTTGYCLPGVLTFLPLTDSSLYDYTSAVLYTNTGRCMSVFAEPSHYAIYVLPCLMLVLLNRTEKMAKNYLSAILITFSILMSSTFTGVLGLVFVWASWGVNEIIRRKISFKKIIPMFLIGCGIVVVFFESKLGEYVLNLEVFLRQSEGRFEGWGYVFNQKDSIGKWFGHGMADAGELIYMAGWPRIGHYFGIIGIVLYIIVLISFSYRNKQAAIIMALMAVLMVGTEVCFNSFFIVYILMATLFRVKSPNRKD